MASIEQRIKMTANELEGRLANDNGVPRNIRKGTADAVNHLMDTSKATDLRISNALNVLAELSNDPNITMESWSAIMQILSDLEAILKDVTN